MKGAVFDWDGTLVDIDEREFHCINETLHIHNLEPITRDFFVRNYYRRPFELGTGPRMVLEAALPGKKGKTDELYETYRNLFAESIGKAKLQDGALDLLRLLKEKRYRVGIATMRFARSIVGRELKALGVDSLTDVLLTREDMGVRRTLGSLEETVQQRARLVSRTLDGLELRSEATFLVGDSWWDIRAGKRVGVKTVLILTGFSLYNDFSSERPDLIVKSLHELKVRVLEGNLMDTQQGPRLLGHSKNLSKTQSYSDPGSYRDRGRNGYPDISALSRKAPRDK